MLENVNPPSGRVRTGGFRRLGILVLAVPVLLLCGFIGFLGGVTAGVQALYLMGWKGEP